MVVKTPHASRRLGGLLGLWACLAFPGSFQAAAAGKKDASDELFTNSAIRHLQIEISKPGLETLRAYNFRRGNEPERESVPATVREGKLVWTNVAVHLKGQLGSFRPV